MFLLFKIKSEKLKKLKLKLSIFVVVLIFLNRAKTFQQSKKV